MTVPTDLYQDADIAAEPDPCHPKNGCAAIEFNGGMRHPHYGYFSSWDSVPFTAKRPSAVRPRLPGLRNSPR